MYPLKFAYLLILIFNVCKGQRKIAGGFTLTSYKKYVVYLIRSEMSDRMYDAWLCGGALVSAEYVITSAACVRDVSNIYVIAGYNKYVPYWKISNDMCIQSVKKKVVFTCVPKAYEFDYSRADKWSYIDIAVIKVESPYNFNDPAYFKHCTFVPAPIRINYDVKYQSLDRDVLIFGWGHIDTWRKPGDKKDYNQESLRYAPTIIIDKEKCKSHYKSNMSKVINDYMVCTWGTGNLKEDGVTIVKVVGNATCCAKETTKAMRPLRNNLLAEDQNNELVSKKMQNLSHELNDKASSELSDISSSEIYDGPDPVFRARRTEEIGICQNDHGGPLVTWAGKQEILIGVASVFMVDKNSKCKGPYLHTSTQCNGKFLACVLRSEKALRALNYEWEFCLRPPHLRGFDMIEKNISWINHPDGPADNEKIAMAISANATSVADTSTASTTAKGVITATAASTAADTTTAAATTNEDATKTAIKTTIPSEPTTAAVADRTTTSNKATIATEATTVN